MSAQSRRGVHLDSLPTQQESALAHTTGFIQVSERYWIGRHFLFSTTVTTNVQRNRALMVGITLGPSAELIYEM